MRYLNQSGFWPSGNPRYYYRPKGRKGIAMPDAPIDSAEFRAAYVEAEKSNPIRTAEKGTLAHAIKRFLDSAEFASKAEGTRRVWTRTLLDLRERYGHVPLATIRTRHIKADLARLDAHPANNRAKTWKALFRWLDSRGEVEIDPARPIRNRKVPQSEGFTAWTRDDFAAFRAHWPHDTPQRLAFEVYYRSCAATVDVVQLGPQRVSDGWLTYTRSKTGTPAVVPWHPRVAPDWFEWTDDLEKCLAAQPRHMTYIVTRYGRPRSHKATSQWFSAACRDAGLDLSAHGIRKGRAAMFRENGASQDQRMAILGHETEEEATAYSKSANLKKVVSIKERE